GGEIIMITAAHVTTRCVQSRPIAANAGSCVPPQGSPAAMTSSPASACHRRTANGVNLPESIFALLASRCLRHRSAARLTALGGRHERGIRRSSDYCAAVASTDRPRHRAQYPFLHSQTPARQRPPATPVPAGLARLLPDAASFVSNRGSENSSFAA